MTDDELLAINATARKKGAAAQELEDEGNLRAAESLRIVYEWRLDAAADHVMATGLVPGTCYAFAMAYEGSDVPVRSCEEGKKGVRGA